MTFHSTFYWACDYIFMVEVKFNHVSKRGHRTSRLNLLDIDTTRIFVLMFRHFRSAAFISVWAIKRPIVWNDIELLKYMKCQNHMLSYYAQALVKDSYNNWIALIRLPMSITENYPNDISESLWCPRAPVYPFRAVSFGKHKIHLYRLLQSLDNEALQVVETINRIRLGLFKFIVLFINENA